MAKTEANLILYAVDLDDLRAWIGCKDEEQFKAVLETIGEDEDAGWQGEMRPLFERLLRRVMLDGELYEGLEADDRYYLTQLLIDLFDEFVDTENLSDEMPLDRLLDLSPELPKGSELRPYLDHLFRGRELGGDGLIWATGSFEQSQPYLGYIRRDECARFAAALTQYMDKQAGGGARPPKAGKGRPSGLLKQLLSAAEECAQTEFDLVSFVG